MKKIINPNEYTSEAGSVGTSPSNTSGAAHLIVPPSGFGFRVSTRPLAGNRHEEAPLRKFQSPLTQRHQDYEHQESAGMVQRHPGVQAEGERHTCVQDKAQDLDGQHDTPPNCKHHVARRHEEKQNHNGKGFQDAAVFLKFK